MHEVDQEQRRRKITEIAVDVIANEGLEAATVRNIAARAGYSTTIITHYFNDKTELLLLAYHHISKQAVKRLDQVTACDPGDILGALLAMTPLDEETLKGWRVYVAFWQRAGHDPEFAAEQRRGLEFAHDRLATIIRKRIGDKPEIPVIARHLIALVHGMAVQNLFDTQFWSREDTENTLTRELDFLLRQLR